MNAVYIFFRTEWPESYTSLDSRIDHQYKRNPLRTLVGFRGLPVAFVVLLASEMIDRRNGHVVIGTVGLITLYLLMTSARAIWEVLRAPRHSNYRFIVLYHLGQIGIVLFFAWIGLVSHDLWGSWVPSGMEFAVALLAGSFASITSIWIRDWLSTVTLPFPELVSELRRDIGRVPLAYAQSQSRKCDSSNNLGRLVEAILLAEAQQRPKWFRRLERSIGRRRRAGTYGVAQVSADRPITDEQSIDLLIGELMERSDFDFASSDEHDADIRDLLHQHNPDPEHIDRIIAFFYDLRSFGLYPHRVAR